MPLFEQRRDIARASSEEHKDLRGAGFTLSEEF
jgi:hypothetical protein